jgi:hypothetical protein
MTPSEYLAEIKVKLATSQVILAVFVVEDWALHDRGYFRARLTLVNGDFLEVAEYFAVDQGQSVTLRYRYQWMDASQTALKRRWDDVPHFPGIAGFPDHVHMEAGQVEPGSRHGIVDLVRQLERDLAE